MHKRYTKLAARFALLACVLLSSVAAAQSTIQPARSRAGAFWSAQPARVIDRDLNAPPGSPVDGDAYLVGAAGTGAWSGHNREYAEWEAGSGVWYFVALSEGTRVWVDDEDKTLIYTGAAWADMVASSPLTNATGLPTAGLVDEAITIAKIADGTDGELLTWDASGEAATVATGTSGNVLTSNGAGAAPTFQAQAGGNDARIKVAALASDQSDITGTTLVEIGGLTQALTAGTYTFKFSMVYQTTATTTGVEFVVDYTGTSDAFVSNAMFGSTGGTAATAIADQVGVGGALGLLEVKTQRAKNARPGTTAGVDTINANSLMTVEGVIVVTGAGNLRILMAAELASLVCRAKAGSVVLIVKHA